MRLTTAKARVLTFCLLLLGVVFAYFDFGYLAGWNLPFSHLPFRLGLDLQGGAHLVYRADTSGVNKTDISDAMAGLRDVIERRVNFFGVTEPLVQAEESNGEHRLIVELAGIFDVNQAINIIGQTPFLEFRTERLEKERDEILETQKKQQRLTEDPYYIPSQLTGRFLQKATLGFDPTTSEPTVVLHFNDEGSAMFADITKKNVGKTVAIYLDGIPISTPVVQDEIKGGKAQITGRFTPDQAKTLVRNLNSGALPLHIDLISQQSVGPTLGAKALEKGIRAGMYAFIAITVFMLLRYRFLGIMGIFAICFYAVFTLFIFKVFGVTLTAAGIAGFILSVGVAVDANVLIFERIREETGRSTDAFVAVKEGFWRAWPSIRDANISTFITSAILFWFGTSIVKGFALTLGIGVITTIVSALITTRAFVGATAFKKIVASRFLYGSRMPNTPVSTL